MSKYDELINAAREHIAERIETITADKSGFYSTEDLESALREREAIEQQAESLEQLTASQVTLLRAAVAAKLAYWDALTALERSFSTELTDEQNDAMANVVDILASSAPSAAAITDQNALEALSTITTN